MTMHKLTSSKTARALLRPLVASVLAVGLLSGPAAMALEEQKGEEGAIRECDRHLCSILLEKNPQGADLKCGLTKTWAKSKIKEADSDKLSWGFGDARCSVDIDLNREKLVAIMSDERVVLRVPKHTAHCVVEESGTLEKVTAVVAPKIEFRNGKAEKIWIRLKSIDGPGSITYTVQTAAQLADTFGLFHRQMIKGINRYIERHCPKTLEVASKPPASKDKTSK
jgi:hypothetical protein